MKSSIYILQHSIGEDFPGYFILLEVKRYTMGQDAPLQIAFQNHGKKQSQRMGSNVRSNLVSNSPPV